jgi:hypothetical protein
MIEEKKCKGPCGLVKPFAQFYSNGRGGIRSDCIECVKDCATAYALDHKEEKAVYDKGYHEANREKRLAYMRASHRVNKDRDNAASKEYRLRHRAEAATYMKGYSERNKEALAIKAVERAKKRRKTDAVYKLRLNLRNRLRKLITGQPRHVSSMNMVGCGREALMDHIQKGFRTGSYKGVEYAMEWNNYGSVWHCDHIRPCKSYDIFNPDHQKACFHYTNLQPLFWWENLAKSDKYEESLRNE